MKNYVEIDGFALLLFLIVYGASFAFGGALILGPQTCSPSATATHAIAR
jgi:hypothetical protein